MMEMVEYIEREAAIRMLRGSAIGKYPLPFYIGMFASADELEKLPAADVAPVRHGRWVQGNGYVECSECNTMGSPHWKCCPVCTARMDLEEG